MSETDIDLRGIVGVLQRRARLIGASVAIVLCVTLVVLFSMRPLYTSEALVLINTGSENLIDPVASNPSSFGDNAQIDSEVAILRSSAVLMSVIHANNLIDDAEFGSQSGGMGWLRSIFGMQRQASLDDENAHQKALLKLNRATHISRVGLTYVIAVRFTSQSPKKSAALANAIAENYLDLQLQAKVKNIQLARNTLQQQAEAAARAISVSESTFDNFISENIDAIGFETGRAELAHMRDAILELEAEKAAALASVQTAQEHLARGDWAGISQLLDDENIGALHVQRVAHARELNTVRDAGAQQRLTQALQKIEGTLRELTQVEISSLNASVKNAQTASRALKQQLRTNVLNSELPPEILTRIYAVQQNAEIARAQYQDLLARVANLDAQAHTQIADGRIVSKALPPIRPSFPNMPLVVSFALLSALGGGVGLAFLYENFVGGFSSAAQLRNVLKSKGGHSIPFVAQSMLQDSDGQFENIADLMFSAPLSPYAESIRRLRLECEQAARLHERESGLGAVILVASSVPEEGKSTVSLALARAFAQSGKSTLLIDCDLRKPSLHEYIGVQTAVGLQDYLQHPDDQEMLEAIAIADDKSPLTLIIGAQRSDAPTDQLSGGGALSKLINGARSRAQIVILDSPPILSVVDGLYLAEHADVIAMVVRWASTPQNEVRDALAALSNATGPAAETVMVLNQQQTGMGSYAQRYAGDIKR